MPKQRARPQRRTGRWNAAVEIERFDADGGIERDLQGLDAGHAVVVGGRVIDGADAAAERLEEEGEISIAAAEIEHGKVADQRLEKAVAAGEQAIQVGQGAEAVPGIPAGIGRRQTSLLALRRRSWKASARAARSRISSCWMSGRGRRRRFQDARDTQRAAVYLV